MTSNPKWPAMSISDAHALLSAEGSPFEIGTETIRGVETRVYKQAPRSLRELYEEGRKWGDREIIVYNDERLTNNVHHNAVAKLANSLVEKYGVKKGDRVTIAMRNYPEWSICFWAITNIGAVVVPLNAWGQGPELEYGISDSGSVVAIVDQERLERIKPHLPNLSLEGLIVVRATSDDVYGADLWQDVVAANHGYADLPGGELPDADIHPEDNATIFYTSGTTGKPKGALGTHRNIITNNMSALFTRVRAILREGDALPDPNEEQPQRGSLISVPFFHATGCHSILVPSYATGSKLVLMHRWDPAHAMELIQTEKINSFGGVPAMVWQVLEHPDFNNYDLSSIEGVGYGGAPSASELVTRIKEAFPPAQPSNGYGLTETSAITTQNIGSDYVYKPESAGVPVAVCEVKIVDDQGKEVPRGEVGEIWIKGPNVVAGYWNKPEATAETFTEGWLRTGDLGRMDEEDFVFILDRAKDMLIRGGENIYCVEVEDALYSHPAVMDAAVVGMPHKVLGEEVAAVVQVAPGHNVKQQDLQSHVSTKLAAFKVPVFIDIRGEPLPRNANGKILKNQLRDEVQH